jgi:hypothetical protein
VSTDLLKYLSSKIQEEIAVIREDLAMGKAKDHGDYKHACGLVRGLLVANNILMETSERMKKDDE